MIDVEQIRETVDFRRAQGLIERLTELSGDFEDEGAPAVDILTAFITTAGIVARAVEADPFDLVRLFVKVLHDMRQMEIPEDATDDTKEQL